MIEDKDYIMRLTHEIVRTLIRLLFQKDIDRDEEAAISAEMAVRYRELLAMIRDGQINEAENLLLDEMEPDNPAWFEMALLFYEKLGAQRRIPGGPCVYPGRGGWTVSAMWWTPADTAISGIRSADKAGIPFLQINSTG